MIRSPTFKKVSSLRNVNINNINTPNIISPSNKKSSLGISINCSGKCEDIFSSKHGNVPFFSTTKMGVQDIIDSFNAFESYVYKTHCNKTVNGKSSCYVDICDEVSCDLRLLDEPKYNNGIVGNTLTITNEDYGTSINNIISLFIRYGLLNKKGKRYYMNNTKLLTWENIKQLTNKTNAKLYWLFRKAIIDCIVKHIIQQYTSTDRTNITINSVGSNNITSDYDLTVYSQQHGSDIINKFNRIFRNIFGANSSEIFDTNIYGKGFITFKDIPDITFHHKCGKSIIYIYNTNDVVQNSQLMWAFVKYYRDLITKFGEKQAMRIFNYTISNSATKCAMHMKLAIDVYDYLINLNTSYEELLKTENNDIWKSYTHDKIVQMTDFISIVNFYGTETYMSRGAFLDTVVNGQMCVNSTVDLTVEDYFMSILENTGYFLHHNEHTKYILRVFQSIENINIIIQSSNNEAVKKESMKIVDMVQHLINEIYVDEPTDKRIDVCKLRENALDITKCHIENYIEQCLKIIHAIATIIPMNTSKINIPFNLKTDIIGKLIGDTDDLLLIGGKSSPVNKLRKILKSHKLSISGTKDELIERINKKTITNDKLRKILKSHKLSTTGNKDDLLKRIKKHKLHSKI